MKKNIVTLIFVLLLHFVSTAQGHFYCGIDDEHNNRQERTITNPKYEHIKSYIPNMDGINALHNQPIKTINVNINILQKDDGSGNFQDNEDTRIRFRQIFAWINQFYSSGAPSDPIGWVEELPSYDSRIRFSIGEEGSERIYFYKNTDYWNHSNSSSVYSYVSRVYPERMNAINVYVFGNPMDTIRNASATLPTENFDFNQYVKCYFWQPISDYAIANLLGHEFGHSLDLLHTYHARTAPAICNTNHDEFIRDVFMLDTITQECNCPHYAVWGADAYAVNGDGITNNLMGGNSEQKYTSPLQVGMMHRSLSLTSVRKYVTCEKSDIALVITNNEFWNLNIKLYQDLIIESGATLTISDNVIMLPDAKIIIKPGGKLIVDGATITTDIYETRKWQGIQVWGIDSLHQYLSNGQYLQGVLELRNGATIENAVCAVDLWNPLDEHSEGGIVWATDAIFRNNAKTVHAINYSNYSPSSGVEAHNMSWFRNCSFIIDSDYIGNNTFNNHVELNNVDGIKFYACSFSVDNTASQLASSISAIYASSAGFTVTSECSSPGFPCPESDLIRSTFNGFDNAIHVTNNGGSVRTFSVSGSEFWNNEKGIYATNTGYATIIKNIFNVGNNAQCNYGIYVDGVANFCIEENNFLRNTSTTNRTYGIAVENSGSYNDIYLNHFNNLYCGNISIGNNVVSGNNGLGLTYTCNTNSGNTHDFGVLKDGTLGNVDNSQGSSSLAAANTFSASQYHFYNSGNSNLTYYYKGSGSKIPTRKYGVILATASIDNECKSHYDLVGGGSGGGMMSAGKTDSLKNKYVSSMNSIDRLNSLSTYKIEKDSTQRIQQEAQMSMLQRECLLAAGDIVRSNLNKEERDFNELREWIGKSDDISSARMIIASYIQQKDFVNAIALAKKLPTIYDLQGEELNEFYDYLEIIRLHESLNETNRSTLQLTGYEIALLEDITENGTGASKAMAEAILAENRGFPTIVISSCPTIPNFASAVRDSDEPELTSETVFEVELSPNPATTNVEVSYTLPEDMTNATLVMTNTLGVNVMTAHLDGDNGKTALSLEELPSGIYFYTIRCGENVKTGKLIKK